MIKKYMKNRYQASRKPLTTSLPKIERPPRPGSGTKDNSNLYKIYERIFKTEMLDFSLVIAYFKLLELQRENIITILEGIRYKLDIKEIQKRIIY